MTTRKDAIPPDRQVKLVVYDAGDGEAYYAAEYVWKHYRFMLDGGSTLDVRAVRDDSDLRSAVLDHTKANKIVGVAEVAE